MSIIAQILICFSTRRCIIKYFDGQDSGWYWGRVDGYDKKKKYFQISYDDGDEEDMTLKEVLKWKYRADQQQAGSGSA